MSTDDVYCQQIAKRAVARAALHWGIETMTEEGLETLTSCLLTYLERLGHTMNVTAEASLRSSMHCNIFDALSASELCSVPAATSNYLHQASNSQDEVVDPTHPHESSSTNANSLDKGGGATWKDLATFCFGPDWQQQDPSTTTTAALLAEQQSPTSQQQPQAAAGGGGAGGKVGPSAIMNMNTEEDEDPSKRGWMAPYPDEVPPFPALCASVSSQGADEETNNKKKSEKEEEEEAVEDHHGIPSVAWGILGGGGGVEEPSSASAAATTGAGAGTKRKREDDDKEEDKKKPAKQPKVTTTAMVNKDEVRSEFLPTFYPPLPPEDSTQRIIEDKKISARKQQQQLATSSVLAAADAAAATDDVALRQYVRQALVQLQVQAGRKDTAEQPQQQPSAAAVAAASSIVPLARASGSRVSRILEGSMDPSTG